MFFKKKVPSLLVSIVVAGGILFSGCRNKTSAPPETIAVTSSTPAIGITELVPDNHQKPYRQFARGLLARTIYKAESSGGLEVEIWDLMVGPGMKSDAANLPGGVVFEVRSGSGLVIVGEKRNDVKAGATLSVDDGNAFRIENSSAEDALSIRAIIVRGAQK